MTQQEKQAIDKKCDEFCEYRRTHSSGYPPREWFMAGVKALDELRKPSERPQIERQPIVIERFSDNGEHSHWELINKDDGDILWSEDSEPEANIGEAVEELSKRIKAILDTTFTNSADFSRVPTEIAALIQPDKELLEALKKICRVAPSYIKNPDDELDNAICEAMLAVYNYEKQGK